MSCARYPAITSPCPRLPDIPIDAPQAWCTLCARPVHNLSALTQAARTELLQQSGPLCVSYRVTRRQLATLAMGTMLLATGTALSSDQRPDTAEAPDGMVIVVGGIRPQPQPEVPATASEDASPAAGDPARPQHP